MQLASVGSNRISRIRLPHASATGLYSVAPSAGEQTAKSLKAKSRTASGEAQRKFENSVRCVIVPSNLQLDSGMRRAYSISPFAGLVGLCWLGVLAVATALG